MYKERNGHIDDGRQIAHDSRCPNCNSTRYKQTVSTESCPDCGLEGCYWGGGFNKVYEDMMARRAEEERATEYTYLQSLNDECDYQGLTYPVGRQ